MLAAVVVVVVVVFGVAGAGPGAAAAGMDMAPIAASAHDAAGACPCHWVSGRGAAADGPSRVAVAGPPAVRRWPAGRGR